RRGPQAHCHRAWRRVPVRERAGELALPVGAEFRWLALVAGVGSALFGASLSWIVAFVLFRVQRDQVCYGDPLIAPWIAVLLITLTTTVVVAVSWYANLRLAERRSARTAHAMRQLIQRAEEYGAGGFALEPITESLVPITSDMEEIDTLSRVLDRNH